MDGRGGAVVEDADRAVGQLAGIVLPGRPRAGFLREGALLAPQAPEDLPAAAVDVVDRPGVSRRHQHASVRVRRERVDVEEVIRPRQRAAGAFVGFGERDVVEARPLHPHEAGPDVDFLKHAVGHRSVGGTADGRQIAEHGSIGRDQRGPPRRELEVMEVRLQAVAGLDLGDPAVAAVQDHVGAEPEPVHGDVPLPPREHRAARVFLHPEVGRRHAAGQRVDPHDPAALIEDHRAGLAGSGIRRDELLSGGSRGRVGRDRDQRRMQVRTRAEALHFRRGAGVDPLRFGADRVLVGDREGVHEGVRAAARAQLRARSYPLAFGERPRRHEACPVALGVGLQASAVHPAQRAFHAYPRKLPRGHAEEADLRLGRGVAAARQRGDGHRAGEDRGVVDGRGHARGAGLSRRRGREAEA